MVVSALQKRCYSKIFKTSLSDFRRRRVGGIFVKTANFHCTTNPDLLKSAQPPWKRAPQIARVQSHVRVEVVRDKCISEQRIVDRFRSRLHPEDRRIGSQRGRELSAHRCGISIGSRVVLPNGQLRWIAGRGQVECNRSVSRFECAGCDG